MLNGMPDSSFFLASSPQPILFEPYEMTLAVSMLVFDCLEISDAREYIEFLSSPSAHLYISSTYFCIFSPEMQV